MARLRQEKDAWFLSRTARYISIQIYNKTMSN